MARWGGETGVDGDYAETNKGNWDSPGAVCLALVLLVLVFWQRSELSSATCVRRLTTLSSWPTQSSWVIKACL